MTYFAAGRDQVGSDVTPALALVHIERESGFAQLFAEERVPMLRLAFLLLGSGSAAEDAVQDAYARVYERWDRIERPGAFLRTCVVNECRARHRRHLVTVRKQHLLTSQEVSYDRYTELADALAQLPLRRRTAVVLRHYLQLNTEEMAEVMHTSEGTVKSSLHRGLQQLKEILS